MLLLLTSTHPQASASALSILATTSFIANTQTVAAEEVVAQPTRRSVRKPATNERTPLQSEPASSSCWLTLTLHASCPSTTQQSPPPSWCQLRLRCRTRLRRHVVSFARQSKPLKPTPARQLRPGSDGKVPLKVSLLAPSRGRVIHELDRISPFPVHSSSQGIAPTRRATDARCIIVRDCRASSCMPVLTR